MDDYYPLHTDEEKQVFRLLGKKSFREIFKK